MSLKSIIFQKILWKFMKFVENPSKFVENSRKFFENHRNYSINSSKIHWKFIEHSSKFFEVSWKFLGVSWKIAEILWTFMKIRRKFIETLRTNYLWVCVTEVPTNRPGGMREADSKPTKRLMRLIRPELDLPNTACVRRGRTPYSIAICIPPDPSRELACVVVQDIE